MTTPNNFFDKIEAVLHSKHPFVLFSKPGLSSVKSYIQLDSESYTINDFSESGFVFAPFDHHKDRYYIPTNKSSLIEIETADFKISTPTNTSNTTNDSIHHIELVSKAIEEIKSSDLEKVVVSRAFQFTLEASNPIEIFKNLSEPMLINFVFFFSQIV